MRVEGTWQRTIRTADDGWAVELIDQTKLPFEFVIHRLET
ncbi:MAG: S-methyl-5-thioribose-1-phosphate isomerase, partial [Myxococcales bacterium]|nr:S-methyl-5-thioribose-1-phosphate isomerase [Myxococcales bacterium]